MTKSTLIFILKSYLLISLIDFEFNQEQMQTCIIDRDSYLIYYINFFDDNKN